MIDRAFLRSSRSERQGLRYGFRIAYSLLGVLVTIGLTACKDLTGSQGLPSGVNDPAYYNTPAGALGMRNAVDSLFQTAFRQYIIDSGLLSDELEDAETGASQGTLSSSSTVSDPLDERILQEQLDLPASSSGGWDSYATLQRVRGAAYQAIGALATYDSAASPALRGEMYALQGYAEIMLADLFCSGVPLSTLDFQGDFTYHPGLTTQEVYADAVAKFDTALTLSTDSVNIQNLARVGKARALLDMDSASAAAQAVADVPDGFQFQIRIPWRTVTNNSFTVATVSDREGGNGLPFVSSDDPRTTAASTVTTNMNLQLYFPQKYVLGVDGYSPTTVADWIEARLIRAEAALAAGDPTTWLSQLNYLRQHATVAGQTQTPLDSLTDPGSDSARVSLMFQERASWMYVTGHRQGDLRREIRQYGREQSQIYPVGEYLAPGIGVYGTNVNAPIPSSENPNPFFHGCRDRNA